MSLDSLILDKTLSRPSHLPVATDLIYRAQTGETYLITHNPAHQLFYFPHMQPDEVLLIKCFDSAAGDQARFTAHTAFDDPTSLTDAIGRASIEL